jgi:hypothetical protein
VTPKDRSRPDEGGSEDQAATKQLDEPSLAKTVPAYLVLLLGRNGNHLRKPYLSLHSAQQALERAHDRGQIAHLILCRLMPVAVADLADLDGEVAP